MIGEFWNGIYKIILCKGNLLSEEMCTILIKKKQRFKKLGTIVVCCAKEPCNLRPHVQLCQLKALLENKNMLK